MNKKQIISWCLFDFANSSYSAVIAAVIFPVYYAGVIVGNSAGAGDLWWGRAISLSMLFIALSSPFLGGIADYAGLRKKLLALYTAICVAALSGLSLLTPGAVLTGFVLIVLANIGMEGGLVFYNSFLPRIAPMKYQGRVSSWGFSVGYAGSICSLLIALPLVKAGHYGLTWIATAVFFAIFSLPAFLFLPGDSGGNVRALQAATFGAKQAWKTIQDSENTHSLGDDMRKVIRTPDAPRPRGVYSQAIVADGFVFVAGQIPVNPKTNELELGDVKSEARLTLRNLQAVLEAAGSSLGDIVYVDLPRAGDAVTASATFGSVESVKAVSDLFSPVSGTVTAVNEELKTAPDKINEDPHGAWIIKVELSNPAEFDALLDAAAYEAFIAEETGS